MTITRRRVVPSETPHGIFYYWSSVKIADITDGTSNTVFFSGENRGNGHDGDARSDSLIMASPTDLNSTYLTCTTTPRTLPADSRSGCEWVMGKCVALNTTTFRLRTRRPARVLGFANNDMVNMPMYGAALEQPPWWGERNLRPTAA